MFSRFEAHFSASNSLSAAIFEKDDIINYQENDVRSLFGGKSFNEGSYRVIQISNVDLWNERVLLAFPEFSGRLSCFGYDWLGRMFATDSKRSVDGQNGVVILEPGTAEVLEVPCNIESFHNEELVDYSEAALASDFYRKWLATGGIAPRYHQCVGYGTPLFLGGVDKIENLEICDLEVYWDISGQLIRKAESLTPNH